MRLLFAVLALLVVAAPATAQRAGSRPRPALPAGADTNEAMTYYNLGISLLRREPQRAAEAFHWASELNPGSADALYAQRIAILMSRPQVHSGYWRRDRRTARNPDVMRADSLYLQALELNPFLYHKLDGVFFDALVHGIAVRAVGPSGDTHEAEYQIRTYLSRASPDVKAWRAYTLGRFDEALRHYAMAIKSARNKASLRVDRGRLFFQLDRADSALTELTLAAEEMRAADEKDLVFIYESKALVDHSIGLVLLRLGRKDDAREAFARALQEDLSYSPAHVQLGFMALDAKDTATAVSEFDLAAQLAPDDEVIRYYYGYTLLQFGKAAEAEAALRQASAINPSYSAPQLALAQALAAQGRAAEAGAEYRRFLAGASRTDPRRAEAEQQLTTVSSESP